MRRVDWTYLKEDLANCKPMLGWIQTAASILAGVAATSAFAWLAQLTSDDDLPAGTEVSNEWLGPVYLTVAIAAAIFAFTLWMIDRAVQRKTTADVGRVLERMDRVEEMLDDDDSTHLFVSVSETR